MMRCFRGNQCRSRNDGVTWSGGPIAQISLAATFCTHCNGMMVDFGSWTVWNYSNRVDWWGKPWDWRLSFNRKCVEWFSNVLDESSRHWLPCWCVSSLPAHYPQWLRGREHWGAEPMTSFPTCSLRSLFSIFFKLALVPNQMTSVFDGFNIRRLDEHHPWMASIHCCSRSMVDPFINHKSSTYSRTGDDWDENPWISPISSPV